MRSEKRERLLAQYYGTDSDWLLNRLRGVVDDCLSWNPSDGPLICDTALGRGFDGPDNGVYSGDFGTGLDLSEPVFNSGGVILGVTASSPAVATAFTSRYTPADHHRALKTDVPQPGWFRGGDVLNKGTPPRLHNVCDWHLAENCENRRRFVLAWPLGNWIVFYVTCSPCARESANRI